MLYPDKLSASDITLSMHGRFTFESDNTIQTITKFNHIETDGDFAAFTVNDVPGYMMRTLRGPISVLIENHTAYFRSSSPFWSRVIVNECMIPAPEVSPLDCLILFRNRLATTELTCADINTAPLFQCIYQRKALGALDDQIAKCIDDGYPTLL